MDSPPIVENKEHDFDNNILQNDSREKCKKLLSQGASSLDAAEQLGLEISSVFAWFKCDDFEEALQNGAVARLTEALKATDLSDARRKGLEEKRRFVSKWRKGEVVQVVKAGRWTQGKITAVHAAGCEVLVDGCCLKNKGETELRKLNESKPEDPIKPGGRSDMKYKYKDKVRAYGRDRKGGKTYTALVLECNNNGTYFLRYIDGTFRVDTDQVSEDHILEKLGKVE
eukprot:CAMPEP_0175129456 /NCGR_PEP_ID=MMETSP0087-20121206/5480_1 /TAXON_ID=136419 /ORGANISM="Unknown Unknown, Strain D1" /LENGTH=226 /DNA_ID=CAMNT_0016411603 /DNA_START=15 /DNA_END=695 /DNA_ORIENTATION=-